MVHGLSYSEAVWALPGPGTEPVSPVGTSLVAQLVKNMPASARDARDVGSFPGQEDLLEKGLATHSSFLFFYFISWSPITSQYCSGSCHTLT